MSEAILTLQRHHGLWGGELKRYLRRAEKAAKGSEESRIAQQGIDVCKLKLTDFEQALKALGSAPVPEAADEPAEV